MPNELKPCPFCRNDDERTWLIDNRKLVEGSLDDYAYVGFEAATKQIIKTIKAEAVKEFAENLKERAKETVVYKNELCVMGVPFVNVKEIDNLVKEMVGDADV